MGDTVEELHEFAFKVGLKREWFQDHRHPHYDITTKRMLGKVIKEGAILVPTREIATGDYTPKSNGDSL